MARKKQAEGTTLSNRQTFRLLPNEAELFEQYAKENGTDRSKILIKIVRELITEKPHLLPDELEEFKNATRQLMGIGRNFNQLVKVIRAGGAPPALYNETYYQAIIERIDDLKESLNSYIQNTKNRWTDDGAGRA
jgi:hypothetical protein